MISIIIPTYNEAGNIKELIERIENCLSESHELIIIDDASPDQTAKIAEELARKFPIKVIRRLGKLGLASAVLTGFRAASGDLLCVMDSDLSHPPEIIPALLENLKTKNADIVVASRFIEGSGIENWPKLRRLNTALASLVVRPLTGVKDPMSGFFLLKRETVQNINLVPRGYKILLEILVKAKYSSVFEFPFVFKDRICGKSKLNLKIYWEFVMQLFSLYAYKLGKCLKN